MNVYEAINAVQSDLAKEGITKDRRNEQQGYKFRGIDDVYNAIAPLLAKHKLCILPRYISRECTERTTAKGGVIFYATVHGEFDFVSALDGSKHTVTTYGEAMDSADKATNKAMSAAYKYAAFQAFAIPTEGDNDADAHHHEVAPKRPATPPATDSADRDKLIDACAIAANGDHELAALILKVCSIFTGKDGVEHFIKPDTIKKATDKHVEASLRNFRKKSESGEIAAIVEDYHQGRAM
jgi:hypothetical protein